MKYPKSCLTEDETLDRALAGENLARFGDGEFNLVIGRNCTSQWADKALAGELRAILDKAPSGCLPCLPNPYGGTPKKANWLAYEKYAIELGKQTYGSAFITRPDSAPWIDTADYWAKVRRFWAGKDVTLVLGSKRSLHPAMISDASSVREVWGTYRDAYGTKMMPDDARNHPSAIRSIGELMEAIGKPSGPVLLCLGPTATVIAARFAKIGVHATDLGHVGMFMRHAGAYVFKPFDLASEQHRAAMKERHDAGWVSSGGLYADQVVEFAEELGAASILDYGCGSKSLERMAADKFKRRIVSYDPAFGTGLPKPSDLVVCVGALEHVEPDKLGNVISHIKSLAAKGIYLEISTDDPAAWMARLESPGWRRVPAPEHGGLTMRLVRE